MMKANNNDFQDNFEKVTLIKEQEISFGHFFGEDEFAKLDELIVKVLLEWEGDADLDISAIMLNRDGKRIDRDALVFYNSPRRWIPRNSTGSSDFVAWEGEPIAEWDQTKYPTEVEWITKTLPLSGDNSVIGSWDNRGGDDDEEDEVEVIHQEELHIVLRNINREECSSIALIASIAPRDLKEGKKFKNINNPVVKIIDVSDDREMIEYQLNNLYPNSDAIYLASVKYDQSEQKWGFKAVEEVYEGGLKAIVNAFKK